MSRCDCAVLSYVVAIAVNAHSLLSISYAELAKVQVSACECVQQHAQILSHTCGKSL